ncbi:hypothetical protein [Yoonia sp. 208BN28-4]|uniref:hypothetical protein n=1 Tax=Yoonia sp. 208BN28-4 TaxID=3126505 RepID=UPI00309F9DB3
MEIVYHIGAHCTDDDRLLKSMLKNADTFADDGVKIPGPGKYRRLIRETIQGLNGQKPSPETRSILLDAILDDEPTERLVLSNQNFICVPNRIFEDGAFYAQTEPKIRALHDIFVEDDIEIFLSLRNPATFVPAAFAKSDHPTWDKFMRGVHPSDIRWSDIVRRIQHVAPRSHLTVWCNEDTPLIWADLIRRMAGVLPDQKITGGFDLLAAIMSKQGLNRFLNYMRAHPPQTEAQKRRIIGAFLDKYALDDEIEEEIDMPGVTEAMIEDLSLAYENDVEMIAAMPGVSFVQP